MKVLGAILAGGLSRRFGSDKALASLGGRALIDHVAARIAPQCDAIIVCGRRHAALTAIADLPAAGLGPLGGLAGALDHARDRWDAVLTVPCDAPDLPGTLVAQLAAAGAPAHVHAQPVIGLWPPRLASALIDRLEHGLDRSMRGWLAAIGSRAVALDAPVANINRPDDLARLSSG